ncbi:MAG: DUF6132 family protein [Candidatus Marinimicrobia bacterium]|nr:DUF6132 family protein [Candidatus Neomarinimicrobiota bacterium]
MKLKKYFTLKHLIFVIIGGILGYIYYHFWGCVNQTCPITSNPYLTILYGMIFGYLLTPSKKKSGDKSKSSKILSSESHKSEK